MPKPEKELPKDKLRELLEKGGFNFRETWSRSMCITFNTAGWAVSASPFAGKFTNTHIIGGNRSLSNFCAQLSSAGINYTEVSDVRDGDGELQENKTKIIIDYNQPGFDKKIDTLCNAYQIPPSLNSRYRRYK